MHIVIDGYNFIFRMYSFKHTELQKVRERFLLRLKNYIEKKKVRMEVVFDSRENEYPSTVSSRKGLKIVFCQNADDYIREVVSNSRRKASILVVSDDGEVLTDVRKCGAKVKSPSEFDVQLNIYRKQEKIGDEKPSPESISEGEVDVWLRKFRERTDRR